MPREAWRSGRGLLGARKLPRLAAGAGFVVPITGEIMPMPGLPKEPLASKFDLNDDGEILFTK